MLTYGDDKAISIQEVQPLRTVLEQKQQDVSNEASQNSKILLRAKEKAKFFYARREDF